MKRLKIFTWNIHGGYLSMLAGLDHELYVPVKDGRPYNYAGVPQGDHVYLSGNQNPSTDRESSWGRNVHEISLNQIKRHHFDVVLLQTMQQVREEQYDILSEAQLRAPKVLIFHTPPWEKDYRLSREQRKQYTTEFRKVNHIVHITEYNRREWAKVVDKASDAPPASTVIYHGIPIDKSVTWKGSIAKAVTATNYLMDRPDCGRIHWRRMAQRVPIELIGADSEQVGGRGIIDHSQMRSEFAKYRLYYNQTNRSSLPMAMLEAMSAGLPVVARSATDLPNVIKNGYNGYISKRPAELGKRVRELLSDKVRARALGENARQTIKQKFTPSRFHAQWNDVLATATVD